MQQTARDTNRDTKRQRNKETDGQKGRTDKDKLDRHEKQADSTDRTDRQKESRKYRIQAVQYSKDRQTDIKTRILSQKDRLTDKKIYKQTGRRVKRERHTDTSTAKTLKLRQTGGKKTN